MQDNKKEKCGVIYILTNPSFPEYVKIGYADDVNKRVKILNSSSAVPFGFRVYAAYDVYEKLEDKKIHSIIDTINPELRSKDIINGKERVREFFQMTAEQAYSLFESIAEISGTKDRLHKIKATKEELQDEKEAEEVKELSVNRHNFKDIKFHSSLTNKDYYTKTSEHGTLSVFEQDTNEEIPNNSNPSKKQIIKQAVLDLGGDIVEGLTLYQLEHRLEKIVLNKSDRSNKNE